LYHCPIIHDIAPHFCSKNCMKLPEKHYLWSQCVHWVSWRVFVVHDSELGFEQLEDMLVAASLQHLVGSCVCSWPCCLSKKILHKKKALSGACAAQQKHSMLSRKLSHRAWCLQQSESRTTTLKFLQD
jgi:hypothetical protein